MYQALYRKWRPQTFDEVVGQKHITETLKNQVKSGRLSHAYIFIGTRGTGKTTCARILAKAVNCEHPVNGNPCGECPACRGIADGTVLDVVELDAASNNGVDNVRALREEAIFSPAAVKKRVYIVDEVHMLSASAFNALLKILEEPPEHLMFILATTELQKVPATILSRCQRHSFRRIDTPQLAQYLEYIAQQEKFMLTHDAAELIARMADGGVRDALSLLDQCSAYDEIGAEEVYSAIGLAGNRRIMDMLGFIMRHDTASALSEFNALWMDGKDPASFLKELSGLLRDVLIYAVSPKNAVDLISGGYDISTLGSFAARITREELICAMETIQRYSVQLGEAKNPKTVVELCLISLCDSMLGEDISSLRARISRLEAGGVAPKAESAQLEAPRPAPVKKTVQAPTPAVDIPPWESADIQPPPAAETAPTPVLAEPELEIQAPEAPYEEAHGDDFSAPVPVSEDNSSLWIEICKTVSAKLPIDVRFILDDESKIRGYIEDDVLLIECAPGFIYPRINRQEVLAPFAAVASRVCGQTMRVKLAEMKEDSNKTRSVDDLKNFKEVHYI